MILSVHQPQYIPWLGYFDKIDKSDCFVFLDTVQYKKREFQNRNKIRTKEGELWLTVPVITKGQRQQSISEVRIDNSFDWRKEHGGSLKNWYGRAACFVSFFEDIYSRQWERLIDLNFALIEFLLEQFNIDTPVRLESEVGTEAQSTDRIIELCQKLDADTYLSGQGGKNYLEEGKFAEAGIRLAYQHFSHPAYRQLFRENEDSFSPNLSAIDLLFNEGKNSLSILKGH